MCSQNSFIYQSLSKLRKKLSTENNKSYRIVWGKHSEPKIVQYFNTYTKIIFLIFSSPCSYPKLYIFFILAYCGKKSNVKNQSRANYFPAFFIIQFYLRSYTIQIFFPVKNLQNCLQDGISIFKMLFFLLLLCWWRNESKKSATKSKHH